MIREGLKKVIAGGDLTEEEMVGIMQEIMSGQATDAQIGGFLAALRMKGETVEEITGAARVMRDNAANVSITTPAPVIDTCGTGGDGVNTFNISTAAAFVAAGAGLTVAKHGNRSVSSNCGSADVLTVLGIDITCDITVVQQCLNEIGIGFLFAPTFHKAMKHVMGPRREMGVRTMFNILGPLTNPAGARCQVLGVYEKALTETMAHVLKNLGSRHVFVIRGEDGMDEITLTEKTTISELNNGRVHTYQVSPEDFGLQLCSLKDLQGDTPEINAAIITNILKGSPGPRRDVVVLNAAAAIAAGGMADDISHGLSIAQEAIDSGRALEKMHALAELTTREISSESG